MIRLDRNACESAFAAYCGNSSFFPLIGAVLQARQDGLVFADNPENPRQYYVEHAFGFAQVFGEYSSSFEMALQRYLLVDRCFHAPKVRLYTPMLPGFLDGAGADPLRSWRQRFTLDASRLPDAEAQHQDIDVAFVSRGNLSDIEEHFGVVARFWRGPEDFIAGAHACVIRHRGRLASICYAAAESNGRAEIDVLTLPEFRTLGLGKLAVVHFSRACLQAGIEPLWDCFVNNVGSMQLCQSVGFRAPRPPYPFFTINKNVD